MLLHRVQQRAEACDTAPDYPVSPRSEPEQCVGYGFLRDASAADGVVSGAEGIALA